MHDHAMALSGATDRVVRPFGGEAAISLSAAPLAIGRPFFVSLALALGVSSVLMTVGRHADSAKVMKPAVVAPTMVQKIVRREGDREEGFDLSAFLRFDPPVVPSVEADPPPAELAAAAAPENPPDPNSVLQFGSRKVARWLVDTLLGAARVVDSDPALLMAIAEKESSFSPTAKARTSSAEGLFQFIDRTWLMVVRDFGAKHGLAAEAAAITVDSDGDYVVADDVSRARILKLRRDPRLAAIMAAEMLKRDSDRIARRVGRNLSSGEIYLAHFLGPFDAERFLAKVEGEPNAVAAKLLPKPARANRPIFFAAKRRRAKSLSVAEVHRKFEDMMQTRVDRFRAVDQLAGVTMVSQAVPR